MNESYETTEKPNDKPAAKPKRSFRVRWSLRVLFLLVALFAVGMAWVSYQMRMGYVHEEVAQKLREHGARIDWKRFERTQFANGAFRDDKKVPPWMDTFGAGPMFQRIKQVFLHDFRSPEKIDEAIDQINRLGSFDAFSCYNSTITEAQVARMLEHVQLESLYISEVPLGRKNLPWLQHPGLKNLVVFRTQFSNPAIDDLPESLEFLNATRTRINDDGLDKFVRLTNLRSLILRRTPTSKEAIEALKKKMPWCNIDWRPLKNP